MKTKTLSQLKLADTEDSLGKVTAIFSTFGVKDHDGDVTLPGAFEEGAEVRISAYNHASWGYALPVGKGTIHSDAEKAWMEGQFFMDTTHGRDTFETVKQLGSLGEWSYGFDILDAETGKHDGEDVQFLKSLGVHEVSPVLLGAGIGTRTVEAKSRAGMKLSEQFESVLTDVDALVERVAGVVTLRTEQGKSLGDDALAHTEALKSALARLEELILQGSPRNETDTEELYGHAAELVRLGVTL